MPLSSHFTAPASSGLLRTQPTLRLSRAFISNPHRLPSQLSYDIYPGCLRMGATRRGERRYTGSDPGDPSLQVTGEEERGKGRRRERKGVSRTMLFFTLTTTSHARKMLPVSISPPSLFQHSLGKGHRRSNTSHTHTQTDRQTSKPLHNTTHTQFALPVHLVILVLP